MERRTVVTDALGEVEQLLCRCDGMDRGHGVAHMVAVLNHVRAACGAEQPRLTSRQQLVLELGAVLHDVDDDKFFATENYANARRILQRVLPESPAIHADVVEVVALTSCSRNGNAPHRDAWKLLVRWADRLEAMGRVGVYRAWVYTLHRDRPLYTTDTPRARTLEELERVATVERFTAYCTQPAKESGRYSSHDSASMIDHFYDKVLHLHRMQTTNPYIAAEAAVRRQPAIDVCLLFGRQGYVTHEQVRRICDASSTGPLTNLVSVAHALVGSE